MRRLTFNGLGILSKTTRAKALRGGGIGGWRLIVGWLVLVGLVLAPGVRAEESEAVNQETGAGSENTAQVELTQEAVVEQVNESNVNNQVSFTSNTGGNEASGNTGDGEVNTGEVNSETTVVNQGASNSVDLGGGEGTGLVTVGNANTGADSDNLAKVAVNQSTQVSTSNSSEVVNQVNVDASTGENQANGNTGEGVVVTGGVSTETKLVTVVNRTKVDICQGCGFFDNIRAINEKTGAGSENVSQVVVNKSTKVVVNDESRVVNQVSGDLNTGGNEASGNTEGGRIETGGITAMVEIGNTVNQAEVVEECDEDGGPGDPGDPGTGGNDEPAPPASNPGGNQSSGTSSSGSSSSNGGSSGGSVAAASIGPVIGGILPATGSRMWMWWMAGLFLFSMGRFIRLMAGRSPAKAYAKA